MSIRTDRSIILPALVGRPQITGVRMVEERALPRARGYTLIMYDTGSRRAVPPVCAGIDRTKSACAGVRLFPPRAWGLTMREWEPALHHDVPLCSGDTPDLARATRTATASPACAG